MKTNLIGFILVVIAVGLAAYLTDTTPSKPKNHPVSSESTNSEYSIDLNLNK
jgi:hypothetical protein